MYSSPLLLYITSNMKRKNCTFGILYYTYSSAKPFTLDRVARKCKHQCLAFGPKQKKSLREWRKRRGHGRGPLSLTEFRGFLDDPDTEVAVLEWFFRMTVVTLKENEGGEYQY
jgi:hypothetical protein